MMVKIFPNYLFTFLIEIFLLSYSVGLNTLKGTAKDRCGPFEDDRLP